MGASQRGRFGATRISKQEVDPWESRKLDIVKWALRHSEQRRPEMTDSEWKVPEHQ